MRKQSHANLVPGRPFVSWVAALVELCPLHVLVLNLQYFACIFCFTSRFLNWSRVGVYKLIVDCLYSIFRIKVWSHFSHILHKYQNSNIIWSFGNTHNFLPIAAQPKNANLLLPSFVSCKTSTCFSPATVHIWLSDDGNKSMDHIDLLFFYELPIFCNQWIIDFWTRMIFGVYNFMAFLYDI
jgi:hypothetical protein